MKISIIGTGYVGLVSGAVFSNVGHDVTCIDQDLAKVQQLANAEVAMHEKQLREKVEFGLKNNTLRFSDSYDSVSTADVVFVAVGTPQFKNGAADLSFVRAAVGTVALNIKPGAVLVIKSTVPPRTCLNIAAHLRSLDKENSVVMNPEFLREGSAVADFMDPARIVIGLESEYAREVMLKVYASWSAPKIVTDCTTAELIKYSANAFLATKIAFINEIANICEKIGGDIDVLSFAVGLDKRIGSDFLKVGPGFGGSCFPKDINALIHIVNNFKIENKILEAVRDSNARRTELMVEKISSVLGGVIMNKKIGVLGLSFKAGTDDVRHSPALEIVKVLISQGATVTAFDPVALANAKALLSGVGYVDSAEKVFEASDCVVVLTEWPEFKNLDFVSLAAQMQTAVILDLRNILDANTLRDAGFAYHKVG